MLRELKRATRPARAWVAQSIYSAPPQQFDHTEAQRYELSSNTSTIEQHFPKVFARFQKTQSEPWHDPNSPWFGNDKRLWDDFVSHVRRRMSLEIGSGPWGYLLMCPWIEKRTIIDPLVEEYKAAQMRVVGGTLFTDDVMTYTTPAEQPIASLVGTVEGVIVCQNAIDHCEDPLAVLSNIGAYAASGCYLLLWTDIWHLDGVDAGHRNITRSSTAIDYLLRGAGFDVVRRSDRIRQDGKYVEYGVLARKVR